MSKTLEQRLLAWQVLDHIEKFPEHHHQSVWLDLREDLRGNHLITTEAVLKSCGTTACYAGWTVLLGDGVFDRIEGTQSISERADDLLGLNSDESWDMFYECLTFEDLRERVIEYFGERP